MSDLPPARDGLRKHKIRFVTNREAWDDECPRCSGNLQVKLERERTVARWRCDGCGWSGVEPPDAPPDGGGNGRGDGQANDPAAAMSEEYRRALEDLERGLEDENEPPAPPPPPPPEEPPPSPKDESGGEDEPELGPEPEQEPPKAEPTEPAEPAEPTEPVEAAPDKSSYTHLWRRGEAADEPCTPTGVELRDEKDGRFYAEVINSEGGLSIVPRHELFAKDDLEAEPKRPEPTVRVRTITVERVDGQDDYSGLDFADLVLEQKLAREQGREPRLREAEVKPDLAIIVEVALKARLDGPFSDIDVENFKKLLREQPSVFARLCRRYPAIVAAVALDAAAVRAMLEQASKDEVVALFIDLVLAADLNPVEIDVLRKLTAKKADVGLQPLKDLLKQAQAKHAAERAAAARAKRRAERTDPRPMIDVPNWEAPFKPVMRQLNEILSASTALEPPTRDIDGYMNRSRRISLPGLHLFSTANEREPDEVLLPAPEQWVLHRMDAMEVAELIEDYVDFVNEKDVSVHLWAEFVKHYVRRHDDVLPLAVTIAVLPIVLADGVLLTPEGLDRKRGIIFKIPKELRDILPRPEECTEEAVCEAMKFLCNNWFCDIAADFAGKCTLLAIPLTMIERTLLPDRPVFWIIAGRRGGGKTTTINMMIRAATGEKTAAAAWSSDENERRKALLGHLLSGVSYVLWDNLPRGSQISCPHIERACTTELYSDRRLGVTDIATAAASAVQIFTGNNVSPCGDLASRSLQARLAVTRPDPENRPFKHPDPVGWTEDNRAKILRSFYTILMGNPMLKQPRDAAGVTRFKVWHRLVGSALEHAAQLVKNEAADPVIRETWDQETREKMDEIAAAPNVDFQKLFLSQETESDEDSSTLGDALTILYQRWPEPLEFKANKVADLINMINREDDADPFGNEGPSEEALRKMKHNGGVLRELLFPDEPNAVATAKSVSHRLNAHVENPIQVGNKVLTLHSRTGTADRTLVFRVSKTDPPGG